MIDNPNNIIGITEPASSVLPSRSYYETWIGNVYTNTGWWCISESINFAAVKRPNRIHKFFIKLLLGWTWKEDEKSLSGK